MFYSLRGRLHFPCRPLLTLNALAVVFLCRRHQRHRSAPWPSQFVTEVWDYPRDCLRWPQGEVQLTVWPTFPSLPGPSLPTDVREQPYWGHSCGSSAVSWLSGVGCVAYRVPGFVQSIFWIIPGNAHDCSMRQIPSDSHFVGGKTKTWKGCIV